MFIKMLAEMAAAWAASKIASFFGWTMPGHWTESKINYASGSSLLKRIKELKQSQ